MLNLNTDDGSAAHPSTFKAANTPYQSDYYNIKLYNRDSDLVAIHEAAKLVSRSLSPDFTINSLLRMMSQMLGLNRGRVLLPEEDNLKIKYSYGLTPEQQSRGIYAQGEGITGKVMAANQLVVIENIDEEPELLFRAVDRATLPQETVSYIALPIMDGSTPIGVLACHRIRSRMRPFDADLVILKTFSTFIGQIIKHHQLDEDLSQPAQQEKDRANTSSGKKIIGQSPAIQQAIAKTKRVAHTDATVLLSGESGSGKERFARMIHDSSTRNKNAFVAINCAAIPEQLLEAELFGHERGAFTGAVAKKQGKFELANKGTLFLDEIGDLDLSLQTKLLRVLETQRIQRVGGISDIAVDVRIIVASHKDLMNAVNKGDFRLDLFYRLNVFPIHLPPLRDRKEDIPLLISHFLKSAKNEFKQHAICERGVIERLSHYEWPGNIRQLENVTRRAVLLSEDGKIHTSLIDHILALESQITINEASLIQNKIHQTPNKPDAGDTTETRRSSQNLSENTAKESSRRAYSWVDEAEITDMRDALEQARGNKTRAAEILGMTARQFRYRFSKLGLSEL